MRLATTIAVDPPWWESGGGKSKRGADKHFPLIKTRDMPTVIAQSPLWTPNPAGCSVWMWATANHLGDAIWVMEALGVKYVTNAVWVKGVRTDREIKMQAPGLGQRFRLEHEHLLYGRIGKVPVPPPKKRRGSVMAEPREGHSRKPDPFMELMEDHDPDGVWHEIFSRRHRPGWRVWGNEVDDESDAPPSDGFDCRFIECD